MLAAGQFHESQQGEIKFPEISGPILEKVRTRAHPSRAHPSSPRRPRRAAPRLCRHWPKPPAPAPTQTVQYFYYKLRYTNHQGTLPEFKIEPEHALELLMAANFLDT